MTPGPRSTTGVLRRALAAVICAAAIAFAALIASPALASRPVLRQRLVEALVLPAPPRGGDGLVVLKSWNRLYLFRHGCIVRRYDVATGSDPIFTPEGTFAVANRADSPGDPAYGPRWLGLAVPHEADLRQRLGYGRSPPDAGAEAGGGSGAGSTGTDGAADADSAAGSGGRRGQGVAAPDPRAPAGHKYGIHGTDEPWTIGSCTSAGCVRLRNEDIIELYDLVPVGTVVEIRP